MQLHRAWRTPLFPNDKRRSQLPGVRSFGLGLCLHRMRNGSVRPRFLPDGRSLSLPGQLSVSAAGGLFLRKPPFPFRRARSSVRPAGRQRNPGRAGHRDSQRQGASSGRSLRHCPNCMKSCFIRSLSFVQKGSMQFYPVVCCFIFLPGESNAVIFIIFVHKEMLRFCFRLALPKKIVTS